MLHRAKALLLLAVIIVGQLIAGLPASLHKSLHQGVIALAARHVQRAIASAPAGIAAMPGRIPGFHTFIIGQHIRVRPAAGPHCLPRVKIFGMAAHINHAIDARRPPNHLAARAGKPPPAQMRLGLGPIAPIIALHIHRKAQRAGHLNKRARIAAAIFHHQDRSPRLA